MNIDQLESVIYYLSHCGNSNARRKKLASRILEIPGHQDDGKSLPGLAGEFFRALSDPKWQLVHVTGVSSPEDELEYGGTVHFVSIAVEASGFTYELTVRLYCHDNSFECYGDSVFAGVDLVKSTRDEVLESIDFSEEFHEASVNLLSGFAVEVADYCDGEDVIPAAESPLSASEWVALQNVFDPAKPALHTAVSYGASKVIADLIEHGVDINAADENGDTALHEAAATRMYIDNVDTGLDILCALIDAGADPDIKNNSGKTFLDKIKNLKSLSKSENERIISVAESHILKVRSAAAGLDKYSDKGNETFGL